MLHRFSSSFYGEPLRVIATGFLRHVTWISYSYSGHTVQRGVNSGVGRVQDKVTSGLGPGFEV